MALLPLPEAEQIADLGICTVIFFLCGYGFILFKGANLIGSGSDMLFQVYGPGIVGGLVIPILGAVPDAAIILFSGMGGGSKAERQKNLDVGIGALAGSTVMLLTIPFCCTIIFGRRYLDRQNKPTNKPPRKKRHESKIYYTLTRMGIKVEQSVVGSAKFMLISALSFVVIFVPALIFDSSSQEHIPAGIGLASCAIMFVWYNYHCVNDAALVEMQGRKEKQREYAFWQKSVARHVRSSSREMLDFLFHKFDKDGSGHISMKELKKGLAKMGLSSGRREVMEMMKQFDKSGDGALDIDEFKHVLSNWVDGGHRASSMVVGEHTHLLKPEENNIDEVWNSEDAESNESDEYLKESDNSLIKGAIMLLSAGTLLVILFSDPMIDAINAFGIVSGIPSFFVAFTVVPVASNAAELLSACQFAAKKSVESATVGVATCYGAACMNNTLCLGVFFALIFFQRLKWSFFAETIGLLTCISLLGILGQRTVFKFYDVFILGGAYIGSIVIIATCRVLFKE